MKDIKNTGDDEDIPRNDTDDGGDEAAGGNDAGEINADIDNDMSMHDDIEGRGRITIG